MALKDAGLIEVWGKHTTFNSGLMLTRNNGGYMHKKALLILSCLIISLFIVACGDNGNPATIPNPQDKPETGEELPQRSTEFIGAKLVADSTQLPVCDSAHVGQLYYVIADAEFRGCTASGYMVINLQGAQGTPGEKGEQGVPGTPGAAGAAGADGKDGIDGEDGTSCTSNTIPEGVEVVCAGVVVDTVFDGADGQDGSAGVSCSAQAITEGLEVSCGGIPVDTIVDGAKGDQGDAGASCSAVSIAEGVEVSCGGVVVDTVRHGQDAAGGASVTWLGTLTEKPDAPEVNQAFYWLGMGVSCIWDGTVWQIMMADRDVLATTCANEFDDTGFTDSRDGQYYGWVKIGTQVWMSENLNFETDSLSYCYGGDVNNCDTYGRLYEWTAAMGIDSSYRNKEWPGGDIGHQGTCPNGWHVPSQTEWSALADHIADKDGIPLNEVGGKLKASHTWANNGFGTDDYGFAVLPAGFFSGGYQAEFEWGALISSTQDENNGTVNFRIRFLDSGSDGFVNQTAGKILATSLRCIQD